MLSATCDIWNSNIDPMIPANDTSKWNQKFLDADEHGEMTLMRTVNNFFYLRIWNFKADANMIEMFASTKEGLYAPKNNWFHLKTALGNPDCKIAVNTDVNLGANKDPFIVSGLYDWNDYVFIAHAGTQPYTLGSEIDASFFDKPGWVTVELSMDAKNPFVLIYSVPLDILAKRRIQTEITPMDIFNIKVSDSRIRDLNIVQGIDTIFYDGVHSPRISEALTFYLVLKDGKVIPDNVVITSKEPGGGSVMYNKLDYLNFTKQVKRTAKYGYYTIYRSKMIDCGRTHRERSGEKGGNIEWTEWPISPQNCLKVMPIMPIDKKDNPASSGGCNPGFYPTAEGWIQESPEVDIDYPGIIISTDNVSLEATKDYILNAAFNRKLSPNTKVNLSAFVNYSTDAAEPSDAFLVCFYYASVNYIRVPAQWVSLSPSGDQRLEYDSVAPNTIACPRNKGTITWQTPDSGYLIARITDAKGSYNPIPTPESGTMIDENWFSEQRNWAKIEIK